MRTVRLYTDDAADNGDTTAIMAILPGGGYGTMKFGTSCAYEVTIGLTSDTLVIDYVTWEVQLNGVTVDSGTVAGEEVDLSVVVAMTPSPCGNIVRVIIGLSHSGSAIISAAITF
jgi:hypothetical protein